jgi:hypothetical protein
MEAEVLYSFDSNEEDELNVEKGMRVIVLDQRDSDWWLCQLIPTGKRGKGEREREKERGEKEKKTQGMLPANYLRIIQEDRKISNMSPVKREEEEEETEPSPLRNMRDSTITSDNLPIGWKMFVEKESGDIYYHNEETGSGLLLHFTL